MQVVLLFFAGSQAVIYGLEEKRIDQALFANFVTLILWARMVLAAANLKALNY
jgi:hypothetical protein